MYLEKEQSISYLLFLIKETKSMDGQSSFVLAGIVLLIHL